MSTQLTLPPKPSRAAYFREYRAARKAAAQPQQGVAQHRNRQPIAARAAVYEAGAVTRRTVGWKAPTTSPNSNLLYSLATIRDRSRQAIRNDGWAKGAIDKLVYNIVGTGIVPLSKAQDSAFRTEVQALWYRWTSVSSTSGQQDFYGQQAQAVRCWLSAGETFLRLRRRSPTDGLPVPLQVEVIEPEMCPIDFNGARGGNRIRAGIEFSPIGERVAYYFFFSRPGDLQDYDSNDLRRVPAEDVIHLYEELRPGQYRGEPHLTPALVLLWELDKMQDATVLRSQLANMFAGFLKTPTTDSDIHPLTGLSADKTDEGRPILTLEPGTFQELAPGEEVVFNDPPQADPFGPAFMQQLLRSIASGLGIPYEILTGDMSGLNDRSMRVVLQEFRRGIQARQYLVVAHQLCDPIWSRWMRLAFESSALPIPPAFLKDSAPWAKVEWRPQGWAYTHPVQDVQATVSAIKAGLTTRSAAVSEQGYDAEEIDREQAADNSRAAGLGLNYESSTGTSKKSDHQDSSNQPEPASSKNQARAEIPDGPDVQQIVVNLRAQAPTVNVAAPVVNLPTPIVNVPAPVVNVPAPVVNVPPQKRRNVSFDRGADGRITGFKEE